MYMLVCKIANFKTANSDKSENQQKNMERSSFIFSAGRAWTGLGAPPPSLPLLWEEESEPPPDYPPQVSTNFLYLVARTCAYAAGAAAIQ